MEEMKELIFKFKLVPTYLQTMNNIILTKQFLLREKNLPEEKQFNYLKLSFLAKQRRLLYTIVLDYN